MAEKVLTRLQSLQRHQLQVHLHQRASGASGAAVGAGAGVAAGDAAAAASASAGSGASSAAECSLCFWWHIKHSCIKPGFWAFCQVRSARSSSSPHQTKCFSYCSQPLQAASSCASTATASAIADSSTHGKSSPKKGTSASENHKRKNGITGAVAELSQ